MLFHILYMRILADEETVDTVVLGSLVTTIVDTTTGYNGYVAVITNVKIIINHLGQTTLAKYYRDVYTFSFGAGLDDDINALLVLFGYNIDMSSGIASYGSTIGTDVIGSGRYLVETGYLLQ
jgi:hypothetical protein